MSDEPHALDDPEKRWRVVKALLICAPFAFFGSYILAWLQGAQPQHGALIAALALAMCLGAAGVIHLMGSRSWMALVAVKIALLLVGRR
jgi:hypothetical protein